MDQLLKLGEALASMARIVAQEESIKSTIITIPNTKFSREDLEYLSSVLTRELPVRVEYHRAEEFVKVAFTRKSV
ncbi:hypothetical protein [Turicibacter sanguinis]|uniref:hypothetical protein n=1 Tax=Turicibacter sanguinis TaxID=154288 RepID=UPI0006BEF751|nr:hypothetical protein [Turicibacter sanguinis]MDB8438627.1 hypothetical protein [Turicibacter sanguinis]MTO25222.1 hypothetical protein [Turicibacter sanguinis]MTO28118.1 hypothetical protein [Turicibacter sanguinis]MTO91056.1 hypothetical protein [Turicibacter sanguinis]MTP71205.1 hypothetical protein [Turicibacter sanguinis]